MGAGSNLRLRTIVAAGLMAAVLSTCVQLLLWWLAGEDAVELLLRDARLTAALVLGRNVLPPAAGFDVAVMLVASMIHFTLSWFYAAVLYPMRTSRQLSALCIGMAFGVVLYVVNLHGFTWLFPWFAASRGVITLLAHVTFGIAVMETLRRYS